MLRSDWSKVPFYQAGGPIGGGWTKVSGIGPLPGDFLAVCPLCLALRQ